MRMQVRNDIVIVYAHTLSLLFSKPPIFLFTIIHCIYMADEDNQLKNPSYSMNLEAYSKKPKYHVKMTTGAKKILDEEQARMLINMISHEFEERPHLNIFRFEKVGLIVAKTGTNLLILTEEENTNSKLA